MYEMLNEFIKPELLVLIPVLYLFGVMFKKSQVNDKYIPMLLGGLSIALCSLCILSSVYIDGWRDALMALFSSVTQGVLCAGASVYVNQLIKQKGKND